MVVRPKPFIGVFAVGCPACGRGFHPECLKGCKKCHPNTEKESVQEDVSSTDEEEIVEPKKLRLKDPASTGRKRAARLYPLDRTAPCEWRGKKNCGGGRNPVVGCYEGNQQHRHHGPVKKTTRNERGNVHRICDDCHVHWHELNDLEYNEADYDLLPHDPVPATDEETITNVLEWKSGVMAQRFTLASTQNKAKYKLALDEES